MSETDYGIKTTERWLNEPPPTTNWWNKVKCWLNRHEWGFYESIMSTFSFDCIMFHIRCFHCGAPSKARPEFLHNDKIPNICCKASVKQACHGAMET